MMNDAQPTTNCRDCGAALSAATAEVAIVPGLCPNCGTPVCYACGCTERHACVRQATDGSYVCAWVGPGRCSFCHFAQLEEVYVAVSNGRGYYDESRGLVLYGG